MLGLPVKLGTVPENAFDWAQIYCNLEFELNN